MQLSENRVWVSRAQHELHYGRGTEHGQGASALSAAKRGVVHGAPRLILISDAPSHIRSAFFFHH